MSFQNYANIIAGANTKTANRRQASENRINNYNNIYNQRGLESMQKLQDVANEKYNSLLEKAQATAIKNLGISQEDREKVESLIGASAIGGPLLDKLLAPSKKKVAKGSENLIEKLKKAKEVKSSVKTERESTLTKMRNSGPARQVEIGRDRFNMDDEFGSEPLEMPRRITGKQVMSRNLGEIPSPSAEQSSTIIESDVKSVRGKDYFSDSGVDRVGVDRRMAETPKLSEDMRGSPSTSAKTVSKEEFEMGDISKTPTEIPTEIPSKLPAVEAEIPVVADVAEAESAVAPLDLLPGIGEIAGLGAVAYGLGEAFHLWGGGSKNTPLATQPHIAPTFQVSTNNAPASYRSFQKAYASPSINTGVMR